MILHVNYEELTALQSGARVFLDREEAGEGSWDGAEQTMIGGAAPADAEWDGAEKTMLGGSDPIN